MLSENKRKEGIGYRGGNDTKSGVEGPPLHRSAEKYSRWQSKGALAPGVDDLPLSCSSMTGKKL